MMEVIVVTSVELGWDCVVGVYTDIKVAKENHKGEQYIFSTRKVNESSYKKEELKIDFNALKTKEIYYDSGLDNHVLLVDSCNIFKNNINLGNTKKAMIEIIKLHLEFTDSKFEYLLASDKDNSCFIFINTTYDDWEDDSMEFHEFIEKRGYDIR